MGLTYEQEIDLLNKKMEIYKEIILFKKQSMKEANQDRHDKAIALLELSQSLKLAEIQAFYNSQTSLVDYKKKNNEKAYKPRIYE